MEEMGSIGDRETDDRYTQVQYKTMEAPKIQGGRALEALSRNIAYKPQETD
jgi:hypothetical protein